MVANRLARWALFFNQLDFDVKYCRTTLHQNADALSRLPQGEDEHFDEEERSGNADVVCAINTLTSQMQSLDSAALQKETAKDPVLAKVLRFTREEWRHKPDDVKLEKFRKLADSLTSLYGCLVSTLWYQGGYSTFSSTSSAQDHARRSFRYPEDEATRKNSSSLA